MAVVICPAPVDAHCKTDSPKAEEARQRPSPLWSCGPFRLDPTVLLISGRYTRDSEADSPMEIEPFRHGTTNFSLNLLGIEFSGGGSRYRLGLNWSAGVTKYKHPKQNDDQEAIESGLALFSWSIFFDVDRIYRIEGGLMHAISGADWLEGDAKDKTAPFIGVTFLALNDQIRKLLNN